MDAYEKLLQLVEHGLRYCVVPRSYDSDEESVRLTVTHNGQEHHTQLPKSDWDARGHHVKYAIVALHDYIFWNDYIFWR